MEKYYFFVNAFESDPLTPHINTYIGRKKVIKYKCPICEYTNDWDDSFDDEKKEQIKLEVETHYNEHIIPKS